MKNPKRSGQALVEVIVAMSIFTTIFVSGMTLLSRSLNSNTHANERIVATYLSAEGIELVKNLIDANILSGAAWDCGISDGRFRIAYNFPAATAPNCPGSVLEPVPPGSGLGRLYYGPSNRYSYDSGSPGFPTIYQRVITIQKIGTPAVEMSVRVNTWTSETPTTADVVFLSKLEDHFFDWRP